MALGFLIQMRVFKILRRPYQNVSPSLLGTSYRILPVIEVMLTTKQATPLFLAPLMLSLVPQAHAQFGGPKVATVTAAVRPAAVPHGGKGVLYVTLNVGSKYHINAHTPNDPAYIATVFQGQQTPGIAYGTAHYPLPKAMTLSYAPKPLLVYTGKVVIAVPFTVAKSARPGKIALAGAVSFQGCDAKSCYPPASAQVRAVVTVK